MSALVERFGLAFFLVVLLVVAHLTSPAFLNLANIVNLLTIAAPLGMVVLGQTFVILVRGLDLSVASLMATVAVLATAFRANSNDMIAVIFVAAIALLRAGRPLERLSCHQAPRLAVPGDARHHDHPAGRALRLYRWCAGQHAAAGHELSRQRQASTACR